MAAGGFPAMLEEAQRYHDEGNAAFRSHLYSKAQEKYELALSVVRQLYENSGWDPYVMSVIVEKDQKLLCNLSKVHRLQGHVMAAVEVGKSCVEKYPEHAKGHYCLAVANRDCIGHVPIHTIELIREAVIHFSAAYKLSLDKQTFLECLLLAVPEGLFQALPCVPESDKKTVFQHVVDSLMEKPEAALELFLRFFLVHSSSPSKPSLECGPGCAVGYVTFKKYNLSTLLRSIVSLDVLQAVVQHGVQVDVGTVVDVIKNRHTSKSDIVKLIVPCLPKAIARDCTAMKPIVDACLHAKQNDLLEYLLQQGVGFLADSEEQILHWKSSSAAVVRVQDAIQKQRTSKKQPSGSGMIEQIRDFREQGTTAFKAECYCEAKSLYMQAYESFPKSAVGVNDPVMSEEMQKVLGNLSVVERSLTNYEDSVKWAKKCVEEFPKYAKGLYRLAEAYRDQASGLKGVQKSNLLLKCAENFGQVFTLSKEKPAYFECLMAAMETGSLHVVPSVPASEKDSLALYVFEHLQKRISRPEEVAHFIHTILNMSPKVLQKIATPMVPACLQDCPLSMLPSSKLPLADVKVLLEKRMMVDMASVCENIEGRKEELEDTFEALFVRLPTSEKSPDCLQRAVGTAVVSRAGSILALLVKYGAVFPDNPKLKASVFTWDPEILPVHVIKSALKGEFPDVQHSDIVKILERRAECVCAWGDENVSHKKYNAARDNFEEAIECYVCIEKFTKKKTKAVAFQRMADVYIRIAKLEKSKAAASQIRRVGLDLYISSFQLQRNQEVFRSMLIVAIVEGVECLCKLPDLHSLERNEVKKMLHFTLKSLLDKGSGYPKELVRECVMFLLIPKPMGVGSYPMYRAYGQGHIRLDDFTLSDMLLVVGFHPWSIQQLVSQGIQIDAASVVTGIKEVTKIKKSDTEDHRSLLLFLYERCTRKKMQLFLGTAISVKERQLIQQFLTDGARLSENNMKSLLSWDASHLVPSLVRSILKSDPPLHVKNSKGESIVGIVARYDMTDCVEALMMKGVKVSDLARIWNRQSVASVLRTLVNQRALTLGDLSDVSDDVVSHDMLSALLQNGMNPTLKNAKGESVLDIVLRLQAYDLLEYLVSHYQDLSCCSLASVFEHQPTLRTTVATEMINKGASVCSCKDKLSPVTVLNRHLTQAIRRKAMQQEVRTIMDNLVLVLERGASVQDLVELGSSQLTTPIHVATIIAMQTRFCQLLEVVISKCGTLSGNQYVNSQGQTPLHEVALSKGKPPHCLFDLLLKVGVDPNVRDKRQKTAIEYCTVTGRDSTYSKLTDYQKAFDEDKPDQVPLSPTTEQVKPEVSNKADTKPDPHLHKQEENEPDVKQPAVSKHTLPALVDLSIKMVNMYGLKEPQNLANEELSSTPQTLDEEDSQLNDDSLSSSEEEESVGYGLLAQTEHVAKKQSDVQNDSQNDFDGLAWEVDCTEKFRKHLGGLPEYLRRKAISVIQRLASGEWHPRFRKCVTGEQSLNVYELRLTKGMRIIWQKAIDYSSRCSEGPNKVVYSEIIRLWDVVKHKDIQQSVDYVTDSLQKGRYSNVKLNLQQLTSQSDEVVSTRDRFPRLFVCGELKQDHKDAVFSPSALPGERDYNVITFYAFSSALVQSILSSGNHRQDFPFKGWPEEHDIINLPEGQTILLLGRSGTGKTTCCVYRLLNQCSMYWKKAAGPYFRRVPLLFMKQTPLVPEDDDGSHSTHPVQERQTDVPSLVPGSMSALSNEERRDNVEQEDLYQSCREEMENTSSGVAAAVTQEITSTGMDVLQEVQEGSMPTEIEATQEGNVCLDHLRQVFITKNPVLVSQVKKKFYDMAASAHHMKHHLQYETTALPPTFQNIADHNFPIFLTSFQWLNLLDASLGDGEPFFPRSEGGVLLVELKDSTGEFSSSHDDIELLDELESDFEEDEEVNAVQADRRVTQRSGADVWRIVDSAYFCDVIWQQITKRFSELRRKYDPVLIWMEIRSFLKGSYEALMTGNGHLDLAEYEKIGAKRASNFSIERKEVYKLFTEYEKYLSQNRLIDQCDWVFDLFRRLTKQSEVSFVIHEVYIDEVQDFTEAELYLIIHCCRFPNRLFVSGDTAQSIMRGVSFRFQDLHSLFYHFSESYLARGAKKTLQFVPKLHKLTQNFRSHSGILNLAALCIRLIQHFFPHSIDILPEDCGLFPGPLPVVLHAASTSDLAIILKGNRREASTIEFGAHQAILVQSDEAKNTLPNELAGAIVLTIFEAKGLEFDDVLLYNFFADSKAGQEWRLVLQYLNSKGVPIHSDFPILDQSVLRPLKFDERQHRCLNAELKYLYTAVTRAKCNLWIFDTDRVKHSPMYYCLLKKGLVRILSASDMTGADIDKKGFVQESSPEEWKSRGDYFMKKRLWEPAQKCYGKCGEKVLAMEAEAYLIESMARKASEQPKVSRQLYWQAAELFLQCATSPDNLFQRHLKNAATCLCNSKEWHTAAQLYESIQEYSMAFKAYHRDRYFEKASEMKEKQGKYHEALQCLHDVGKFPHALKKALDFKQRGIEVTYTGLTVEDLAYRTARHHHNRQELKLMKECIDLLPDVDDKVRLLKVAKLYKEAVTLLVKENLLQDAFRILAAQKEYDKGIKLATSKDQGKQVLRFLLMKARALPVVRHAIREICAFQEELDSSAAAPDLSRFKEELKTDLLPILGEMSTTVNKYHLMKECPLLCMEMTILECICHLDAAKMRRQRFSLNVFGMVEQMRIWIGLELANHTTWQSDDMKVILRQCEAVVDCFCKLSQIHDVAKDVSDTSCSLQQWYCIETDITSFIVPKDQDVWVSFDKCLTPNAATGEGALKLDSKKVMRQLKHHLCHSLKCWLSICRKGVERKAALPSVDYHNVISDWTSGHMLEAGPMEEFLRCCCEAVYLDVISTSTFLLETLLHHSNLDKIIQEMPEELLKVFAEKLVMNEPDISKHRNKLNRKVKELLANKEFGKVINAFPVKHSGTGNKSKAALLSYFSPKTSVYIPLSDMHLVLLDEYPVVKEVLLSQYLPNVCRDINAFMSAWWMNGSHELLQCMVRTDVSDGYHLDDHGKTIHCFLLWIKACNLFNLPDPKPLAFCKILCDRFFSCVILRRSVKKKFDPVNALIILELLTATLVAMLSCQESILRMQMSTFPGCVPYLYEHFVQLFNDSCSKRVKEKGKAFHLMDVVYQGVHQYRNVQQMEVEARRLLIGVIELILGKRFRNYNVLKYVILGKNNVRNGTLRRYCILLLTLLGNFEFLGQSECYQYRYELVGVVQSATAGITGKEPGDKEVMELCNYLCAAVQYATCTSDLFHFASQLCCFGENKLAMIQSNDAEWTLNFQPVHLDAVPNVPFPKLLFAAHPNVMSLPPPSPHYPPNVQSGNSETPWPDSAEASSPIDIDSGEPFISTFDQAFEDTANISYDNEEEEGIPALDIDEQAADVSAEKEFIKSGWCSACGVEVVSAQHPNPNPEQIEEHSEAPTASDTIQHHIQSTAHADNVKGYREFDELKISYQQNVLPLANATLNHPEAPIQYDVRHFDKLIDKLQKSYQELQQVLTPNVAGQTSRQFWSGKCKLLKSRASEVKTCVEQLKGMLPKVEPVAASQDQQESLDDIEDGLELEELAPEPAVNRLEKTVKRHKEKHN